MKTANPLHSVFPASGREPGNDRLRENNFDILRLIFASMVVLFHIGLLSGEPTLRWMHTYISSTFAVQAFFVVSGFLVTMSYERSRSVQAYARKRLMRILPPYVAVVLVAAIGLSLLSRLSVGDYFVSAGFWRYVIRNLMFSNFEAPALPGVFVSNPESAVNGSLWTIKIELAFYCFVPLCMWCMRRLGGTRLLAAVFVLSIAWKLGFEVAASHTGNDLYVKLAKQLPGQLSFFIGGAYAYMRTQRGGRPPSNWMAALAAVIYVITSGLAYSILAPLCVAVIVYWAAITLPVIPNPVRGGDYSYGIYLYHFPLAQVFIASGAFAASPLGATVSVCAIAVALAYGSWHVLEKRCLGVHRRGTSAVTVPSRELTPGRAD